MFEYLMPLLVMRDAGTAACSTRPAGSSSRARSATARERGVPWGISESGYNARDLELNYQYRAFGVPGLGLKRGLGDDLVIAPYATALGADGRAARRRSRNLARLRAAGARGRYGFYEALDYTRGARAARAPTRRGRAARTWRTTRA